jgi:hypothetical protein
MISDEIDPADALEAAVLSEEYAGVLLRILTAKLKNRTLRYQYDAMLAEEKRHEELLHARLNTLASGRVMADDVHGKHGGIRLPNEQRMNEMPISTLLDLFSQVLDRLIETYEDAAVRLSDQPVKTLFQELSEIKFTHKSKVLTDLHLMKLHPDYC